MPSFFFSILLGIALGFCLPPFSTGLLAIPLMCVVMARVAGATSRKTSTWELWWTTFSMLGVHLSWIVEFLSGLFPPPLALILSALFLALQALLLSLPAYVSWTLGKSSPARIWMFAGCWGLIEYLRFQGPLAFPWPVLGYALVPTPLIQIADLGGVLLVSALLLGLAASLAEWVARPNPSIPWSTLTAVVVTGLAMVYGLTRSAGDGPTVPVRVLRTDFSAAGRAHGSVSIEEQFSLQLARSMPRPPSSVVVWSESAVTVDHTVPAALPTFPGPGITGLGVRTTPPVPGLNGVISVDAGRRVNDLNLKAHPVPFGETFPLYQQLPWLYGFIEHASGMSFAAFSKTPATDLRPLRLGGFLAGAYICYDSVFPEVARELVAKGAGLLVNPSNDGWYEGMGVAQHFWMGRVRAIEQRRWLVRSVNGGIAGSVNDLGQPVSIISTGGPVEALDVSPKILTVRTVYNRLGSSVALLCFAAFLLTPLLLSKRQLSTRLVGWKKNQGKSEF